LSGGLKDLVDTDHRREKYMSDKTFLDWPFFEDSHRQLAQTCESWALAAVPGITDQHDTNVDRICQELVAAMGEAGWLTYCVPESCGGRFARLDVRSLCLIRETFARVHPLADFSFAMQGLGSGPMSLAGSTEQQQTWLPRVASGKAIAAFALSEPEAGSDVGALSTEAVKKADGYVLMVRKPSFQMAVSLISIPCLQEPAKHPVRVASTAFWWKRITPGWKLPSASTSWHPTLLLGCA